ncbi:MAG: FkbM family methyltransferase [Pirellulales bacterium]
MRTTAGEHPPNSIKISRGWPETVCTGLWRVFNALPEGRAKMRLRFFMAFNRIVPRFIQVRSPIRASIFKGSPESGNVVVDAGAFPGDFTVYASRRVGPSGRVIAFEPHPLNFERLRRNVAAFGCDNVIFVNKGLWSYDGQLTISNDGGVSATIGSHGLLIQVASLDHEIERLGITKVDFIKMDIEGAEIRALEGCGQILKTNDVRLAIGSYHEFEGQVTYPRVESILRDSGYETITEYPWRLNTYANRKLGQ